MKKLQLFLILIISLLSLTFLTFSCDTTEPTNKNLQIMLEDASCTEAWLTLSTNNIPLPTNINLLVNEKNMNGIKINTTDTVIYVDSLQPNQTYKIYAMCENQLGISNSIQVTTMDTTDHDFDWQSYTFDVLTSSSTLYDIAIIDENNIWIVGEIYITNSPGTTDQHIYNAVHWDGTKWELKRVPSIICGNDYPVYSTIFAIYAFNENDIFFSDGGEIIHFDGKQYLQDCAINSLLTGRINRIWGSKSNDLYVVGNSGSIIHYNGITWKKIETHTEYNFTNIYGIVNSTTGKMEIYSSAVDFFTNDAKIYKIKSNYEIEIINITIGFIYSFWTQNGIDFYLCGDKLYRKNAVDPTEIKLNTSSPVIGIVGNNYNDIYVIGADQFFSHFNGTNWYLYPKTLLPTLTEYTIVAATSQVIVVGGTSNSKVEIIIGNK
ncbi:MAG: glucosyl transferase [Ignavibacteriae bacterium]|nr:glucosyl transferase [Ignavibacteriota bacterium]